MEYIKEALRVMDDPEYIKVEPVESGGIDVTFRLQSGPRKEIGVNGCKASLIILFVKRFIEIMQSRIPCQENAQTRAHLKQALAWQYQRDKDRSKRKVLGTMRK